MTSPRNIEWSELAELLKLVAQVYRDGGQTEPPSFAATPPQHIEDFCDEWFSTTAAVQADAPLPPPPARPWALARLICASALAKSLAKQREPSPGPLDDSIIRQLLVEEWHGAQKAHWKRMFFRSPY